MNDVIEGKFGDAVKNIGDGILTLGTIEIPGLKALVALVQTPKAKCPLCKFMAQQIQKKGADKANDYSCSDSALDAAEICLALGLGPEDPLADIGALTCGGIAEFICGKILDVIEEQLFKKVTGEEFPE